MTFEKLAPCPGGQVLRATGGTWACSNAIVIDGAGNVGIGTATPGERLQVAGNIDLSGMLAVRGGPRYTSASTAVADHGLVTFTHNLGYVPWCTWSSSNENSAVSMRSISGTQIQLIGWSPSLGQSTNVVVRCW